MFFLFYQQPKGCKKGLNCTHSHEINGQLPNITKVPKMCYNGPSCTWKPGCRYVHPEDGETIPVREALWQEGRRPQVKVCDWSAAKCPRGGPATCTFTHRPEPNNQGFASGKYRRPPPEHSLSEFPDLPTQKEAKCFQDKPLTQVKHSKWNRQKKKSLNRPFIVNSVSIKMSFKKLYSSILVKEN